MYNPGFSIFKLSSGIKKKEKKKEKHLCSREQKRADAIKEKRRNRMTMSEASVDDVIVLTHDVTARVCVCVNVHASVLICVPVCVTLSVSSSSSSSWEC